jgi:hypothetical protein
MLPWIANNVEANDGAYLIGNLRRETRHRRKAAGGIVPLRQW